MLLRMIRQIKVSSERLRSVFIVFLSVTWNYKSLCFFILKRFTQISDESRKRVFDRKSVFSKDVTFALSMKFLGIAEIT